MPELKRKLVTPPQGSDGLYIQPREVGPARELIENHNRQRAANHSYYADPWTGNTRTYDPKGIYPCGGCNMHEGVVCTFIKPGNGLKKMKGGVGPLNLKIGSCEHFEDECAGDPEQASNLIDGSYGVPLNGEGWSCARCPLGERAFAPDSKGRDLFCRLHNCRVLKTACCKQNAAPEVGQRGGLLGV